MQTLQPYSTPTNCKLKNHDFKIPNTETKLPDAANPHYQIITLGHIPNSKNPILINDLNLTTEFMSLSPILKHITVYEKPNQATPITNTILNLTLCFLKPNIIMEKRKMFHK